MPRTKESGDDRIERETALQRHGTEPPAKESGTTEISAAEKLEACIEWVENEIAKTLEEDPSGFLLGVQSASVVDALREVAAALERLREALATLAQFPAVGRAPDTMKEIARAALERHP